MDAPTSIAIGAHVYRVDWSASHALRDRGNRGESTPDRALIQIDGDLAPSVTAETVFHEALHCAWAQTSLRVRFDDDQEEEVITALAPLLLGLVRRNADLVAWLGSE